MWFVLAFEWHECGAYLNTQMASFVLLQLVLSVILINDNLLAGPGVIFYILSVVSACVPYQ